MVQQSKENVRRDLQQISSYPTIKTLGRSLRASYTCIVDLTWVGASTISLAKEKKSFLSIELTTARGSRNKR